MLNFFQLSTPKQQTSLCLKRHKVVLPDNYRADVYLEISLLFGWHNIKLVTYYKEYTVISDTFWFFVERNSKPSCLSVEYLCQAFSCVNWNSKNSLKKKRKKYLFAFGHLFCTVAFFTSVKKKMLLTLVSKQSKVNNQETQ